MGFVTNGRGLALPAWSSQQLARPARRRSETRQQPPVALLGGLLQQLQGLGRADGGSAARNSKAAAARRRLLEQLYSQRPDTAVISEACDELMAAEVPFKEADLGGGPWQVRASKAVSLGEGAAELSSHMGQRCHVLPGILFLLTGCAPARHQRRWFTRGDRCCGSCGRAAPALPPGGTWLQRTEIRCAADKLA